MKANLKTLQEPRSLISSYLGFHVRQLLLFLLQSTMLVETASNN